MKRLLALFLTLALLSGLLCMTVSAHERPAGSKDANPVELASSLLLPDMSKNIAKGLTAAPFMSHNMLNAGSNWNDPVNVIPELELADIGNHFKYGFSMLGISNLERSIKAGVDGIWSNGNTGEVNTLQFNTTKEKGAISWVSSGVLYNVKGEPTPEGKGVADGYIYQNIFTFNFGKVANLEGIGYAHPNGTNIGFPQAADIYVSDDGINWTYVGYYDRPAKRMAGGDYDMIPGDQIEADELGKMTNKQGYAQFILPTGTKGQFLRVAATSATGKTNPSNKEEYDTYSNAYGEKCAFREFFVFGSLTDEVKTPWMDPADDPYLQATQTTEAPTKEKDTVAPKPVETKAPTAEETKPVTVPGTTEPPAAEEKKGCGASAGLALGLILAGAGAVTILARKKED